MILRLLVASNAQVSMSGLGNIFILMDCLLLLYIAIIRVYTSVYNTEIEEVRGFLILRQYCSR